MMMLEKLKLASLGVLRRRGFGPWLLAAGCERANSGGGAAAANSGTAGRRGG